MHFRLVAVNGNGRGESADKALKGFVCPLAAGTTWNYRYIYSYHAMAGEQVEKRGHQVWRSTGAETANAIKLLFTRIDTTRTWYPGADTTTLITEVDTSFSIVVTAVSYDFQWWQFARHSYWSTLPRFFRLPRVVEAKSDTVTTREGQWQSSFLQSISVNGVGLISWQDYNASNYFWNEQLILESVSQ